MYMNEDSNNPEISIELIQPKHISAPPQLPSSQNFRNSPSVDIRDSTNEDSQTSKMLRIINKPAENRNKKQKKDLLDFASEHPYLGVLIEKVSVHLVKTIFKKCRDIVPLPQNTVISKEGDKIEYVTILLFGKMTKFNKNRTTLSDQDFEEIYEKIGLVANAEVREIHRQLKRNKTNDLQNNIPEKPKPIFYKTVDDLMQSSLYFSEPRQSCFESGIIELASSKKFMSTTVLEEDSWVLRIPKNEFLIMYNQVIEKKIEILSAQICTIPCFCQLPKEALEIIILSLSFRKKNRGTKIYTEGIQASSIYFLLNGTIKLFKSSKLFEQNPNQLYANRIEIMLEEELAKKKSNLPRPRYEIREIEAKKASATLPYADLTSMFGYQPKTKNIEIGTISEFCLFGEQELIYDQKQTKKRQTSAVCESLQVQYYEISWKKILGIVGKNLNSFIRGLKEYCSNKVIRRQDQYAQSLNFQNSINLNYFYDSDRVEGSSHKFRILKVNKKLMENKKTIDFGELGLKNQKKQQPPKKTLDIDRRTSTSPLYTAFNFHKLKEKSRSLAPEIIETVQSEPRKTLQASKLSPIRKKKSNPYMEFESPKPNKKHEEHREDSQYDVVEKPNKEQMKIFNVSHTWKLMKKRVIEEEAKSVKMSPIKYSIGVHDPLIDNEFLRNSDLQKRRVERMIRKQKITLVKKDDKSNKNLNKAERMLIQPKKN